MSGRFAGLLFAALVFCVGPASARPTTFLIEACGLRGSGALVNNVPGLGDVPAIMTALHVLRRCPSHGDDALVEVRVTSDKRSDRSPAAFHKVRAGARVLAYPGLDLVFIPIPKAANLTPASLEESLPTLRSRDGVDIRGVDRLNLIPEGFGDFRYSVPLGDLRSYLMDQGEDAGSFGSLDDSALLLVYQSTGVPGNSGAGVYLKDKLIGMHQGGGSGDYSSTTWAVSVTRADLAGQDPVKASLKGVPTASEPRYGHSTVNRFSSDQNIADVYPDGRSIALFGGATVEPANGLTGFRADLGYFEPLPGAVGRTASLGFALGMGAFVGRQDRRFFSPIGSGALEPGRQTTTAVLVDGGAAALFCRNCPLQILINGLYEVQARIAHSAPDGELEPVFAHGPALHVGACSGYLYGACLRAGALYTFGRSAGDFSYELGGESAAARDDDTRFWAFSAAVGGQLKWWR